MNELYGTPGAYAPGGFSNLLPNYTFAANTKGLHDRRRTYTEPYILVALNKQPWYGGKKTENSISGTAIISTYLSPFACMYI